MIEYDLVVIGAGSGGLVAATTANRRGLKTALIEKNKIGGECTHSGCVPSKALLASAKQFESTRHFENYGLGDLQVQGKPDFGRVMQHVKDMIENIYQKETPEIFQEQGIEVFTGKGGAKFFNPHTVKVGEEILHFKNALICTGSSPLKIDVPGSDQVDFLHNENFWDIRTLPQSLAFIGGGVISAEIGQALSTFGTRVSILDRNEEILKVVDPDVRGVILSDFASRGMNLITSVNIDSFEQTGGGTLIKYFIGQDEKQLEVEKVFLAVGRKPNTDGLDLFKADIDITSRGIKVNKYLQTSVPHIYAAGDVTSPLKFTHAASYQAYIVVENILRDNDCENDMSAFPWAIFTDPEIGHVGLSEEQAREKYSEGVHVFTVAAETDRFVTDGKTRGFLKVIFNGADRVVGAEAIGARAGEWIQLLTMVIKNKIDPETMCKTTFAYPTYSEIVKKCFTRYLKSKS